MGRQLRTSLVAVFCIVAAPLWASDYITLAWEDLIPEGAPQSSWSGIVDHSVAGGAGQLISPGVRDEWNDKNVRIPGFVVPLAYDGDKVSTFILVPYVGACVHVPAPPPNQLVLVTASEPFAIATQFEAVYVTGQLETVSTTTDLAEIGYSISSANIGPYDEN